MLPLVAVSGQRKRLKHRACRREARPRIRGGALQAKKAASSWQGARRGWHWLWCAISLAWPQHRRPRYRRSALCTLQQPQQPSCLRALGLGLSRARHATHATPSPFHSLPGALSQMACTPQPSLNVDTCPMVLFACVLLGTNTTGVPVRVQEARQRLVPCLREYPTHSPTPSLFLSHARALSCQGLGRGWPCGGVSYVV